MSAAAHSGVTVAAPCPRSTVRSVGAAARSLGNVGPVVSRSRSTGQGEPNAHQPGRRRRHIRSRRCRWTSKDALLYAVGIGAGTNELAYTTENTNGVEQQVFPTFPVVIGVRAAAAPMRKIGTFNPAMLVHGQQAVTLHQPLPVEGTATLTSRDRRRSTTRARPRSSPPSIGRSAGGRRAAVHDHVSAFIRGEGGWGGDRGPSGPAERAARPRPRPPGHVPDLARPGARLPAVRRPQPAPLRPGVRGDGRLRPPDPARPVHLRLHRPGAAAHAVRIGDPARFQHIEGRFSSPVLPGDALTISMWETGDGEAVFTTAGRRPS